MANKITTLQVKRGVEANRDGITPLEGEPLFTTDNKELFIGDGATAGGIPVGTVKTDGAVVADNIPLFKDATGKVLYAITKTALFQGYATEQFVTNAVTNDVPNVKVNSAAQADVALDAQKLNGRSDQLTPDNVTDSYTENDQDKVVSSVGVYDLYTTLKGSIQSLQTGKVNVSDITSDLTSTSVTKVASAAAIKVVNDKANTNATNATQALTKANQALLDSAAAKASGDTAQTLANEAKVAAANNRAQLDNLPQKITKGLSVPTGGVDGDVYLQYKA